MSKYVFSFNKETSTLWFDDPNYNELFIRCQIEYFRDAIKRDRVVLMKDVLKHLGFDIKTFDIKTLCKYWNDGDVDITFMREEDSMDAYNPKPNAYLIILKTDN